MKKYLQNTRLHFLIIALSLIITTTVLGLVAFLDETKQYSSSFKIVADDELHITLSSTPHDNENVTAGMEVPVNLTVKNDGSFDVYLFAEITDEDDFFTPKGVGAGWALIDEEIGLYCYGEADQLEAVTPGKIPLLDSVIISEDAFPGTEHMFFVTVFATDSVTAASSDPMTVWNDLL